MRTYLIVDESRFDGMTPEAAQAAFASEVTPRMVEVTWDDLVQANEPETLAEIDRLVVGERTTLGQCDPIERLT